MSQFISVSGDVRDAKYLCRQSAIGIAVAALHGGLFWLVIFYGSFLVKGPENEHALLTIDIADVPSPSAPAKAAQIKPVPDRHAVIAVPASTGVPVPPASSGNGSGEGCAMAATIAKAIANDPTAMAALATLPRDVRTDADAVMLWNGGWMDSGPSLAASIVPPVLTTNPLAALKQSIIETLDAMPADCLAAIVTGPQLIPIVEPNRTTMLVIGSGNWKWADVIDPAVMPSGQTSPAVSGQNQPATIGLTGN